MLSYLVRACVVAAVGSSFLFACSQVPSRKSKGDADGGEFFDDEFAYDEGDDVPDEKIPVTSKDAGTITVPPGRDAAADATADVDPCGAPQPGDLVIVEMMIASKAGSNDTGEWVEVLNTRSCSVDVNGVSVSSKRGGGTQPPDVATFNGPKVIPPKGTFLVVNDLDGAKNGGLSGDMISWQQTDVLKNDSDEVTISIGGVPIDTLTYKTADGLPAAGTSFTFPVICPASSRTSLTAWEPSIGTYGAAGLKGTPNAWNADVAGPCTP